MASNDRESTYIATALLQFACIITIWRLVYRYRSPYGLRWGDGWAAFAMINTLIFNIGLWITSAPPGTKGISEGARVAAFYFNDVAWTFVIWAARLSILWTIMHIAPTKRLREYLRLAGFLFVIFALVLSAQKFWVCVPQKEWTHVPGELCSLGKQVAIMEIVTDVIGDTILCVVPTTLFWTAKGLRANLRIRLCTIFSMSFLTTVFSLWQVYCLLHPTDDIIDILASDLEIFVALTVCNFGVVVAAIYKMRCKSDLENNFGEPQESDEHDSPFQSEHFYSQSDAESRVPQSKEGKATEHWIEAANVALDPQMKTTDGQTAPVPSPRNSTNIILPTTPRVAIINPGQRHSLMLTGHTLED